MNMQQLNTNDVRITTEHEFSSALYQVEGSEISWRFVPSVNHVDFKTNENSHLWGSILSIYSKSIANLYSIPSNEGGFSDTSFGKIYDAYYTNGMYVGSLSDDTFRTAFNKTLKLTIPITGGTGTLSGVTSLDIFSGMLQQDNSREKQTKGFCGVGYADNALSDYHEGAFNMTGIGQQRIEGINPDNQDYSHGLYQSGYISLWSDLIDWSGATTGNTWSTNWSGKTKYTTGDARLGKWNGSAYNEAVGVMDLNTGLIALFHDQVVNNFNTTIATGGTISSGLTFNTSDCYIVTGDRDTTTAVNINVILGAGDFSGKGSTNPSRGEASLDGTCDDTVYITNICFHDERGKITAYGYFDTPVEKPKEQFVTAVAKLSLDGGFKVSPHLSGRPYYDY